MAFQSRASDLVPGDTNNRGDVFVHDRLTGDTTRVSVASDGSQASGSSGGAQISANGRFVAFSSYAADLVLGDTNRSQDVFVHDRSTGETTRISVASDGSEDPGWGSFAKGMSADGRIIAFESESPDFVPGDTNGRRDIFVRDRSTGETTRVSVASDGSEANYYSETALVSGDGRFVTFWSAASNLVPGDTNVRDDVFVHDRSTGETTRVSVASDGSQADGPSYPVGISADGRFIAFTSYATNLVPGDTNGRNDVFVHDRSTGETTRVSVASDGSQADRGASNRFPNNSLSADGRFVAFTSYATNLVPGDTNSVYDMFVHDRLTGETARVSVALDGSEGNYRSGYFGHVMSADGRVVAFHSDASNLLPGDTNGNGDVFVAVRDDAPVPEPAAFDLSIDLYQGVAVGTSVGRTAIANKAMGVVVTAAGTPGAGPPPFVAVSLDGGEPTTVPYRRTGTDAENDDAAGEYLFVLGGEAALFPSAGGTVSATAPSGADVATASFTAVTGQRRSVAYFRSILSPGASFAEMHEEGHAFAESNFPVEGFDRLMMTLPAPPIVLPPIPGLQWLWLKELELGLKAAAVLEHGAWPDKVVVVVTTAEMTIMSPLGATPNGLAFCPTGNPGVNDVIFVLEGAPLAVAHELGHAFDLAHPDGSSESDCAGPTKVNSVAALWVAAPPESGGLTPTEPVFDSNAPSLMATGKDQPRPGEGFGDLNAWMTVENYDWLLATEFADPPVIDDADGDGIDDSVDTQPGTYSDAFSATGPSGSISGVIENRGDQTGLLIGPVGSPSSLFASAAGGAQPAIVRIDCSPTPRTIRLSDGDMVGLLCGSLHLDVLAGPVEIDVDQATSLIVDGGSSIVIDESPSGDYFITVDPASSGSVQLTVGSLTFHVPPGTTRAVDNTPPVITASASPAPNLAGWNNTEVIVTYTCTDALSGVAWVSASPILSSDGAGQSVTGSCSDLAGNVASATASGINIDQTAPVVQYTGGLGTYSVEDMVSIACSATDALSGVASHSCSDISGPAWSFGVGASTFNATATDFADNVGGSQITVTVEVTYQGLCALTNHFSSKPGITNAMCASLAAAGNALARGDSEARDGALGAYLAQLSAQSGKALTADGAVILEGLVEALP